jgi:hypothetical protein
MAKKQKKVDWKKITGKAFEDAIKKLVEVLILAVIIGAAIKVILWAVPAVTIGSLFAKFIKAKIID